MWSRTTNPHRLVLPIASHTCLSLADGGHPCGIPQRKYQCAQYVHIVNEASRLGISCLRSSTMPVYPPFTTGQLRGWQFTIATQNSRRTRILESVCVPICFPMPGRFPCLTSPPPRSSSTFLIKRSNARPHGVARLCRPIGPPPSPRTLPLPPPSSSHA